MNESNLAASSPPARGLINQPKAARFQLMQGGLNILHLETEVMNSLPAFFQKLCDRRERIGGLQKLDAAFAHRMKGDRHALVGYRFLSVERQTQCVAIDGLRLLQRIHGNPNMTNPKDLHNDFP